MVIEEHARLELFLPDGRIFEISESDLIQNSLSVTSQCVNGNTFGFGCVSPAQLSVKFRIPESEDLNRYDIYGAKIRLYSCFGDHQPESENLRGIFNVTTASKKNGIFTVSALDNICLLDNTAFLGNSVDNNNSDMANRIYQKLGSGSYNNAVKVFEYMGDIVQEYTGEQIAFHTIPLKPNNIPNGSEDFIDYGNNEVDNKAVRKIILSPDEASDNIRDYFSWLAEYMGGFIHAKNDGNIQFSLFENPWAYEHRPEFYDPAAPNYPYHTQETERTELVEPQKLYFSEFQQDSLEIAGFRIYLYSAKVITESKAWNYSPKFYNKLDEDGVINVETILQNNVFVESGYNVRLQYGVNADLRPITEALYYYQIHIPIRPFSGTYHGKQYLHLGQYIQIIDKDGTSYDTIITNITWKFRGGQQIRCVGEDSRTLSQTQKRSQAVRMGERMKTQINRTESNLRKEMGNVSTNVNNISENQTAQWNTIREQQEQINELWNALNGG